MRPSSRPASNSSASQRASEALARRELTQHVVQDAAVAKVLGLGRSVDAQARLETECVAAVAGHVHRDRGNSLSVIERLEARDRDHFGAYEAVRLGTLAGQELQGCDAHAHEVGPVNALVTLDQYRSHAEQLGALGGPV